MAKKPFFPHDAFRRQDIDFSLSGIFRKRNYEAKDVKDIRTSFYMNNFHSKNSEHCYTISWASAYRGEENDNFAVSLNWAHIQDDKIFKITTYHGIESKSITNCPQSRVLKELQKIETKLKKDSVIEAAYLTPSPVYLHDSIHIALAREIFDHPCKKDEIEYHLDRIKSMRPQKIKFG